MSRNYRDRAFARLCARWLDQALRRPDATVSLAASLETETVAALDLYSKYDEGLVKRDRRQRMILAWMQDKPNGKLQ
jgi:hypothetical protein